MSERTLADFIIKNTWMVKMHQDEGLFPDMNSMTFEQCRSMYFASAIAIGSKIDEKYPGSIWVTFTKQSSSLVGLDACFDVAEMVIVPSVPPPTCLLPLSLCAMSR